MSFTLLRNLGLGALLGLLFGVAYLSHMQVEHSVSLVHTLVRKDMPDRTALLNGRLYLSNARNHFDLFVRKDPIQAQDIQAQTDALEATILDLANTQGPSDTRLLALYNEVQSIKTGFRIYLQEENIDPSGDGATELTERLRSQVFSLRKRVNHSTQDLGATNSDSAEVWEAGERIRDLVVELSEAMTRYLGRERLSLEPVINLLDMAMERFQLPSREDLPPNLVGLWSQLIKKTTQCRALVRNFEQEMRHDPSQESFLENQDLIRRQWEDTEVTLQQVVDGFLAHVVAVHDSLLQSVETTRAKTHAIVLVGALLALVIAIALGRTLSLRLRTLAGATERLAQGELEYRLNVNTADDFGRLAASFNVMAERIQEDNTHLREAARAAREADAAKSRFLATMSHEIRTPMNGVLGMVELLRTSGLSDKQQRYAVSIRESGRVLLALINDLLDFSRIEAGRLELETTDFDLLKVLTEVRTLLSELASEKGLVLQVDTPPLTRLAVRGDPGRLRQVLLNLVGNAIKFTEQGSVKLALINERDTLGERLEFVIEDTGIGIDPQAQRKIFDVFTQADGSMSRRHGGSGLGLAISRQLTELMGGELSLESEPGIGSTFRVRLHLPFAEAPESLNHADQPTETPRLSPKAAGTSPRVLLVEDNPVNQTVAVAMLEEIGVLVEVANNGAEALSAIENSAFDLVFMDCQMPEMDGFEATQRIRALSDPDKRQIPVVAMTANALKGDREYCLSVGMSDYLTKPFSLEQLYEMVARWLPVDPSTPSQSTAEHSPDAAVSRH